jgi:single-strand DNA-binding protein
MTINIEFIGRASSAPEVHTFQNGTSVTKVDVAVHQGYYDQSHTWVERETAWFKVQFASKQAMSQVSQIQKGSKILIVGTMKIRNYQDKQDQPRQSLDVSARHVALVYTEPRQRSEYPQQSPTQGQVDAWQSKPGKDDSDPWATEVSDEPAF